MNLYGIARTTYNATVRPILPRKHGTLADVDVRYARLFDIHVDHPDYKAGLLSAIHDHVRPGDHAILVAFGRGVSSVHLARQGATVTAFEGAENMIELGRETIENEGVADDVTVHHAVVGDAIDLYGSAADAAVVPPGDLPDCDVLVLDCEGAERSILNGLGPEPRTVLVETHPSKGAPEETVRTALEKGGYTVVENRDYEPDRTEKRILVAENERKPIRRTRPPESVTHQ